MSTWGGSGGQSIPNRDPGRAVSALDDPRPTRNSTARGKIRATMSGRYVFDFDEPAEGGKELLGGKGAGLAEMTALGVLVPAGFTITTDACRDYSRAQELPEGLEAEIDEHIAALEAGTGKRFGHPPHRLPP